MFKTAKRIIKWIGIGIAGLLALAILVLLIIAFNSSGKEEPILDEHGKKCLTAYP